MEYDEIKNLINDMGESKLTAIDIEFSDGTKISMKKEAAKEIVVNSSTQESVLTDVRNLSNMVEKSPNTGNVEQNCNIVKSPMVGTFYLKPSPDAEPYVKAGKNISKGDTLCIIEAMKLMNEIESEFSGKILEVLVNDGEPVEYGTPLFKIQ